MKAIFVFFLAAGFWACNLNAQKPALLFEASGDVTDISLDGNVLYVATVNGTVDVFNIKSGRLIDKINVPGITDFMGDSIPAKVYSVDKLAGSETVLIVSQGNSGFRNVFLFDGKLNRIIDAGTDKMMIREARFVNATKIIMGLTSDELLLFDLNKAKTVYRKQISHYTFSDLVLNEDKSMVLTSDESGVVRMFEVNTGKPVKEFKGENVDNIFKIDFKNNVLICGGQDRRVAVYNTALDNSYHLQKDFLIYCAALSPQATVGAFSANEDNDVQIFDIASHAGLQTLKGHESTITCILFVSQYELITACEAETVRLWKLEGNNN